ncbi:MAG: ArnT family glycosyltransferase [Planctomycetota bacterium]|jgi:4-amino-4-deoxy-L-arabinose transferase-like glycosyltransferase
MTGSESQLHGSKPPRPSRFPTVALILLAGGSFLAGAWGRELWSTREARVAACAQGMLESGDWVVPRLSASSPPRLRKPPLAYWLAAGAGLVVGGGRVTELAAKLPSVLAGLGAVLGVFSLGRRATGSRRAGFLAALLLAGTALFWVESNTAAADMTVTFFAVLAVLGFWRVLQEDRRGQLDRALPWLALGLGFLGKGPVAVAVPLVVVAGFLALRGKWRKLPELLPSPLALILFLGVALPWYFVALRRCPEALDVWMFESVARIDREAATHAQPFYYYLSGAIWAALSPWVLLLPALVVELSARRGKRGLPPGVALAASWLLLGLIFFSAFSSKRQYYMLILTPGFALAAGWLLDEFSEGRLGRAAELAVRIPLGILGGVLALAPMAAALAPALVERFRPGEWPPGLSFGVVPLACFAATGALIVVMSLAPAARRRPLAESSAVALSAALVWAGLTLVPALNARKSPARFCAEVDRAVPAGEVVANVAATRFSMLAYYLGRNRVRNFDGLKGFRRYTDGLTSGHSITEDHKLRRWMKRGEVSARIVLDSGGRSRRRVVLFEWKREGPVRVD